MENRKAAGALKKRTAVLSVAVTSFLTITKIIVGVMTGSLSVIAEGLHSFLDFIAAMVAYLSISKAGEPADRGHHYGHSKFEALGAFIEGLLILVPYLLILYYAIKNIHTIKVNEEYLLYGMILMAVSIVLNLAVGIRLGRVGKHTHSLALKGDSLHLISDAMTSAAVLVALVLIKFTGKSILDPIFAIAVSIYVIVLSGFLLYRAGAQLLDTAPPEEGEIRRKIQEMLKEFPGFIFEAHNFRCRGQQMHYFIDFHLVCCRYLTLEECHGYCDRIEDRIREVYPGSDITIHTEPCNDTTDCPGSSGAQTCVHARAIKT